MKQYKDEYAKFRAFLMRNLKSNSRFNLEMPRSLCGVFETSQEQSDWIAYTLLKKAETQPKLKEALLKWHPSIYKDKAWTDSLLKFHN